MKAVATSHTFDYFEGDNDQVDEEEESISTDNRVVTPAGNSPKETETVKAVDLLNRKLSSSSNHLNQSNNSSKLLDTLQTERAENEGNIQKQPSVIVHQIDIES